MALGQEDVLWQALSKCWEDHKNMALIKTDISKPGQMKLYAQLATTGGYTSACVSNTFNYLYSHFSQTAAS